MWKWTASARFQVIYPEETARFYKILAPLNYVKRKYFTECNYKNNNGSEGRGDVFMKFHGKCFERCFRECLREYLGKYFGNCFRVCLGELLGQCIRVWFGECLPECCGKCFRECYAKASSTKFFQLFA